MYRAIVPLLLISNDSFAHPGHNAPLLHVHHWEWNHWALIVGMIVIAGLAVWRAK